MTDINKTLEDFLENAVNLNPDRFNRVEDAERILGEFIENSDIFKDVYIETIRQGSARQKTIIKPVDDSCEFDVDLLVMLEECPDWSPADYHSNLAKVFKDSDRYSDITDTLGKTRCVTIDYAGDFHVDLVPAIERDGETFIFNKTTDEEERTDGDGYAQWFERQDECTNGYLVPVVRLLKYLRDSKNDFETKSIILTTIAGMQVRPDDNFVSISDAFVNIIQRINDFLAQHEEAPTIQNPAMPDEDFNRHWKDDGKGFTKLKNAINVYADIATAAHNAGDTDEGEEHWRNLFGDDFKDDDNDSKKDGVNASAAISSGAYVVGSSFKPTRPWSDKYDNTD